MRQTKDEIRDVPTPAPSTRAHVANRRALVRMAGANLSTSRRDGHTDRVMACHAYRGAA